MNTKTRLTLMFSLLLLAFGATVMSLRVWYAREADRMMADLQQERSLLRDQVLKLTSQSLQNFATDYSNWDEMLAFVKSGDLAWAPVNIDASLQTFNVQAAWVLRADGSLVYGATRQLDKARSNPPMPIGPVLARMRREKFCSFFLEVPEGLLEVRTAPIQPSSDVRRDTEPQGWLLVAQLWNDAYLRTLAKVLDSDLRLIAPEAKIEQAHEIPGVILRSNLTGCDDRPVRQLYLNYRPNSLIVPLQNDEYDMIIFCSFGILVIACTAFSVSRWVIRPLATLEESMQTNSSTLLAKMLGRSDEFGRLAHLTVASFAHRTTLEREIADRARAEKALRESEEKLRLSSDLRTRLARDLHDNVIQSIYATGLGLESIRRSLRTDPATSEQHLEAVSRTLNQLIREIRSFISGLEPESTETRAQFAQVLQTLASTLQALHPIKINLDLNPLAAARLTPQEEVHALQIVREGVSNALRHGGATQIELRLLDEEGVSVLRIEDNGRGFDPTLALGHGSGLRNQAARAQEMGASLAFDSTLGKGTYLTLRFVRSSQS